MPLKMLVVDDEPDLESLVRQRFRKQIRENEFSILFARSGLQALDTIAQHPDIHLVLSDINMPEMDGLTLLSKLSEMQNPLLKAVVVSAYGDMGNIRTAMNRGAFDFVTKPIDFNDLEITINKTIEQIKNVKQSLEDRKELVAVQHDLSIARRIQQSILPTTFPPFPHRKEIDIYAEMRTAKEVGGDLYDFFFVDNDHLGFIMADVSGKGVPAAIFMAMCRAVLKTIAMRITDPGEVLQHVNATLIPESDDAMFVTIFYGILDTKTGDMTYSCGGHSPPYLLRADGEIVQLPFAGGTIVGKLPGVPFASATAQVLPGEKLFTYTDGVTEAMNHEREMFEENRLVDSLKKSKELSLKDLIGTVVNDIGDFTAGAPPSDDITMMVLRYNGSGG
jgi:sigma-B regulation protein RsbU (phosphoserine phosphatase)